MLLLTRTAPAVLLLYSAELASAVYSVQCVVVVIGLFTTVWSTHALIEPLTHYQLNFYSNTSGAVYMQSYSAGYVMLIMKLTVWCVYNSYAFFLSVILVHLVVK